MKCTKCGYENDSQARFCERCGYALTAEKDVQKHRNNPYLDKARNLLLFGFLGLDLILSLILTLLGVSNLPAYAASTLAYAGCIVFCLLSVKWIRTYSPDNSKAPLIGTLAVGITASGIMIMNVISVFRFFSAIISL